MIATLALIAALHAPPSPPDSWVGPDKVKHFLMSAFIHSATFSAGRTAGLTRSNAQRVGGVITVTFAVGKEIFDRRRRRPFSVKDLAWDLAGGVAAAALLNGTR